VTPVVLLVDDDDRLLSGLVRALRRQPYQLCTARSAEDAMYVLKAHEVDLIVADEQMPGMSGSELLAWAAKHYPEVMRIVLTGCAQPEVAIRAINEGAVYHFFQKPCDEVQLAIAIRKALEHKQAIGENRRLLELHAQQTAQLKALNEQLAGLAQTVAAACGSGAAGDAVLEAVAKVDRLLAELSEHAQPAP
jgi:two-component system, probable response regulator PhcQ